MKGLFKNIRIVLQNPKESYNIGAVCRAMKNMGLLNLDVVCDTPIDRTRVKTLAVHAYDVFENARFPETLEDAVRDSSLVAGITRRQGKMRKYIYFTPEELAGKILDSEKARVSLVFGNEEAGLTHEELALCHMAVTIPSSPLFPSLNLSHAVQVIAYEIYKASLGRKDATGKVISAEKLESVTGSIIDSLAHTGFFKKVTPESMKNFFRDILGRAMLDEREAKRLSEVFKKIRGIVTKTGDKS